MDGKNSMSEHYGAAQSANRLVGVVPTIITLAGLWLAFISILLAANGALNLALIGLMLAGLCDMYDGLVARSVTRSDSSRSFGKHIDSLADMANFGVAPALIGCFMGMATHWTGILAALFYVTAVALRLAQFNVRGMTTKGQYRMFVGLPSPYPVLLFPWLYWLVEVLDDSLALLAMLLFYVTMGLLFVSKLLVPKPQGVAFYLIPAYVVAVSAGLWWFK